VPGLPFSSAWGNSATCCLSVAQFAQGTSPIRKYAHIGIVDHAEMLVQIGVVKDRKTLLSLTQFQRPTEQRSYRLRGELIGEQV